jgi:hypothetical protein
VTGPLVKVKLEVLSTVGITGAPGQHLTSVLMNEMRTLSEKLATVTELGELSITALGSFVASDSIPLKPSNLTTESTSGQKTN